MGSGGGCVVPGETGGFKCQGWAFPTGHRVRQWSGRQLVRFSRAEVISGTGVGCGHRRERQEAAAVLQTGEDRALCESGASAEGETEAWAPEEA